LEENEIKKLTIIFLSLLIVFVPCSRLTSAKNILRKHYEKIVAELFIYNSEYMINEEKIFASSNPYIYKNRTLVPLDVIGEIFHPINGEYDGQADSIKYWFKDLAIILYRNNPIAVVNGNNITLDASAMIRAARFQIPIRFIAETLGASVEWEPNAQKITIIYEPK
jgi:tyrosine-protein phosphatase YwqE